MVLFVIVLAALGILIVFYLYAYFGAPSPKDVLADLLKDQLKPKPLVAGQRPLIIGSRPQTLLGNSAIEAVYVRLKLDCGCCAEIVVFFRGRIHQVNMTFVDGRLVVWAKNGVERKTNRDDASCLYKALDLVREAVK